jgi:hypothetical protein
VAGAASRTYGGTVAKRRLSRRLAALRERAGLKSAEVDARLGWARGKLQRIERNEWILPNHSYIRDLLWTYEVPEDERAEIMELADQAGVRLWWRQYAQQKDRDRVFDNEFPGFETDAAAISVYMPLVVPGLLQTRAYAQALMRAGTRSEAWQERALTARMRRQEILGRTDGTAPRLRAVITEASLMYRWGTQAERRDQVTFLATAGLRPNIELRLLPFAGGPHPGMSSLINLFDFPDDEDESIVYLETDTSIQEISKAEDVDAYAVTFGQIRQASLPPGATAGYLEKLAETLE